MPAQIQPPLHAELEPGARSASLIDDRDRLVKLVGVNWYGAESPDFVPGGLDKQSATQIAQEIKQLHFNSVRLPFSNYIVECDPVVKPELVAKLTTHPIRALEVYDQVIAALASRGLMVILDDHNSDPTWSPDSNNTLWYNSRYSAEQWISDWVAMTDRYRGVPAVIGADLRNEPTGDAQWGSGGARFDWRQAAERAGDAVLSANGNPHLLVMVEGVGLGINLSGAKHDPICLLPGQQTAYAGGSPCPSGTASSSLVYSAHDYASSQETDINSDYGKLTHHLDSEEGWADAAAAAPLWIGEFGTCNTSPQCVRPDAPGPQVGCRKSDDPRPGGTWFANFTDSVAQAHFSWAYWPLNGTESTGGPYTQPPRDRSQAECYGLLDRSWNAPPPTAADLICALQSMINPSAATYPAAGCGKIPVPSTGGAAGAAATELKTFEPWVAVGQNGGFAPAPGLSVTKAGTATCDSGSNDDPGSASAVRCSPPGNGVPCFVYMGSGDPSNPLLCSSDPTSSQVIEVAPSGNGVPADMLNGDDPSQPPWFLVLADGQRCHFQGYGTNTATLSYDCGASVFATTPDRSHPAWTVREGTNQASPTISSDRVPVVTAYR